MGPPCWPPLPSLAFWEPLSLLRVSVLVFCSARLARKRGTSAVDPNLLDLTPLLPSSANLNPPNASEGLSVMSPPVHCPLMSLMKSSWPHSQQGRLGNGLLSSWYCK